MQYYAVERSPYLIHYGVKGMKWGVRRYQDYNGHRIGSKIVRNRERDAAIKRMNITRTGTGDPDVDREYTEYFQKAADNHPIEKLSEIERYDSDYNIRDIRSQINRNPDDEGLGRSYNCPNCAAAFEMVERGYSVTAREKPNGSNVENIESFFKGGKLQTVEGAESIFLKHGLARQAKLYDEAVARRVEYISNIKKEYSKYSDDELKKIFGEDPNTSSLYRKINRRREHLDNIADKAYSSYWQTMNDSCDEIQAKTINALKSQGNGARGVMVVGWAIDRVKPEGRTNSYHAFNYKVENGKVNFYDAQSRSPVKQNGGYNPDDFFRDADPRDIYFMRTDNLELSDNITTAVYSNKRKGKVK